MAKLPPTKKKKEMRSRRGRRQIGAFTLIELLVVMGLLILIMAFVVPAVTGLKGASGASKAIYDVAGALEEARAYAVANNSYVWVGIAEVDQSQNDSRAFQTSGVGRVAMVAIASRDGSKIYDETDPGGTWVSEYNKSPKGGQLVQIGKLVRIENTHLADGLGTIPASGNMARPQVPEEDQLGNSNCISSIVFPHPLGSALDSGQYNFTKVIQFDSQGGARIVKSAGGSSAEWIEINLQQTHGKIVPLAPANPNTGNHAAIQIDCLTGAVKIYRP